MIGYESEMGTKMLRTSAMLMLATAVVFSSACKKKKPVLPPAATPPTITAPEPQPAPTPNEIPAEPTVPPVTTATKPKPKHPRLSRKPKPTPPPQETAPAQQPQTAKANPPAGATSGEPTMSISPDLPKTEVESQKRATEQLLQSAEGNLRKLNRQLSDGEQQMTRQVRNYITQSRLATQDGDLERAHNLAVKANLLSAELVK